jgi:hypothetical protein
MKLSRRLSMNGLIWAVSVFGATLLTRPAFALVFNVVDYGANPAPAGDDTIAIRNAMAAAAATPGAQLVFFPPGTYVTATVSLYPNVSIQGSGRATIIKAANDMDSTVFGNHSWSGPPASNFSIRFLEIDGNNVNNDAGNGIQIAGQNITIEGLYIHDTADAGIAISSDPLATSKNIKLLNNWVHNPSLSGRGMGAIAILHCNPGTGETGAVVRGNLATTDDGFMSYGIAIEPNVPTQKVLNTLIEENTVRGGFIGASATGLVRDVQILNNRVDAAGVPGSPGAIRIESVTGIIKVNNNSVVGDSGYSPGIRVTGSANPQVTGNFVTGMGVKQHDLLHRTNVGIYLDHVSGGTITNNTIAAAQPTSQTLTAIAGILRDSSAGQVLVPNLFHKITNPM